MRLSVLVSLLLTLSTAAAPAVQPADGVRGLTSSPVGKHTYEFYRGMYVPTAT